MSNNKSKILIVDDEENILISLSFLLKKEGYEVATAINGIEAIDKTNSFSPDLILLDVMMPEMDGFTAARAIRNSKKSEKPFVIFLTAKGTMNDRRSGYISGADDYIIKPFDNQNLLEKIREILS